MFDETDKYKEHGHFFFSATDSLEDVCNASEDKVGIFTVYELKNGGVNLVYIGFSITSRLKKTIVDGRQFWLPRKKSWPLKMLAEDIDALDVY